MQALRFSELGSLDKLQVVDLPEPAAGEGELVVRVRAAAINPSDVKNVLGKMEGTTLPRTPGRDFAGIVSAGLREWIGREVWGSGGDIGFTRDGAHAAALTVPIAGVREKPKRLSFEQASAVGVPFLAAWLALVESAKVQAGETVLITGAAGAVGSAGLQIARWRGARTLGADLHAPADRTAADDFVQLEGDDAGAALAKAAERFSGGAGMAVCLDTVGGPLFEPCLRTLGQRGRQVNLASVGERRVSFDLLDFYHRRLSLHGVDTRAYDTVAAAQVLEALAPGFESGALKPPVVTDRFALAQAREAFKAVDRGAIRGKAVFTF